MALELAAARLYAPFLGNSVYVWGGTISVTLASLALGSAVGGRIADRTQGAHLVFFANLFSGLYQLLSLFGAPLLLRRAPILGEVAGSSIATAVIFGPAMAALATTTPMIIRLLSRPDIAGSVAGKVYSLSTAGGIGGVVLTILFLIPRLGTHETLKVLCLVSLLGGLGVLFTHRRLLGWALIPAVAIFFVPKPRIVNGTVWTGESAYNLITVAQKQDRTMLFLNSTNWIHTMWSPSRRWTGFFSDYFAVGPLLAADPERLLLLGLGGGAAIHAVRATRPSINIDAVEIDPKVAEAALSWFGLDRTDPSLKIRVADARVWVSRHSNIYDLIYVDLYNGGPHIPFHVITQEFFGLLREHIAERGVLVMNILDRNPALPLVDATAATVLRSFGSVQILKTASENYMLFGFPKPRRLTETQEELRTVPIDPSMHQIVRSALQGMHELTPPPGTIVFTDDLAPVEEITHRALCSGNDCVF